MSWTPFTSGGIQSWWGIYKAPNGVIYGADASGESYVYKSEDGGSTWSSYGVDRVWTGISGDLAGNVYLASNLDYIHKLNGSSFEVLTGSGSRAWYDIDCTPGGDVYAVSWGGYIYKSVDGGMNWTELTSAGSRAWSSIDARVPSRIRAVVYGGAVYESLDGGTTWALASFSGAKSFFRMRSFSANVIYANEQYGQIYRSMNGGATWTALNTAVGSGSWCWSLHPLSSKELLVGLSEGYIHTYADDVIIYSEAATVTLSDYTEVTYYTLDGSDPLDVENLARRVYVGPFKVLPVSSKVIKLHVATVQAGHKSISTYPSNPTILEFSFVCNPWKISDSSFNSEGATVTGEGNLKINVGTILERTKALTGDYYFKFNIKDVVGNSSLVFGLKSYLGLVNNLCEGEYTRKWPSPALTFLDRVGDVITCNVGYRYGLNNKNNFDEVGSFNWNITDDLPVTVFVKEELTIPAKTILKTASELTGRVSFPDDVLVNNMQGIRVDPSKSIIVSNIPSYSKRVVVIPDSELYSTDDDFIITKHGHAEGSELVIVCEGLMTMHGSSSGTVSVNTLTLKGNSSYAMYRTSDNGWYAVPVDNTTAYIQTKKMKLASNGVETEYVPVSSKELDYLMIACSEVNDELNSFIEIGDISGGCL